MNRTQTAIIEYIRAELASDTQKYPPNSPASIFISQSDDKLARTLFQNYRVSGDRGLRLTKQGYAIVKHFIDCVEVGRKPLKTRNTNLELLYLDRYCKMPYFYASDMIALFDIKLGMKIKLVDGDISGLARAEDFHA